MGSKKEGAQRVLDAHASSLKVKGRLVPVAVGILAIGLVVAYLTRWEFGLATVLMCGLLFQYAVERMNTLLEAGLLHVESQIPCRHRGTWALVRNSF